MLPDSPASFLSSLTGMLLVPRAAIAFIADLDDARRVVEALDPSASDAELDAHAADILAGHVLVVRCEPARALDSIPSDRAPRLCSLAEEA